MPRPNEWCRCAFAIYFSFFLEGLRVFYLMVGDLENCTLVMMHCEPCFGRALWHVRDFA